MFHLAGKHCIPGLTLTFDGTRLDRALHLPMHLDLDVTDLGKLESVLNDLVAALGIGEGVIAIATFEAGIAWGFTIADTTEEGIKGFVESFEHILLYLAVDVLVLFPKLLDGRQLIGLHPIGNGHAAQLIGLSTLLQGRIVQFFAAAKRPFQRADLLARWVQAKLVRDLSQIRVLWRAPCLRWCGLSVPGHGSRVPFWLFLRWSRIAVSTSPLRERSCC